MKRMFLVLLLAAAIFVLPVTAQDFTSPRAQFISFSLGLPLGYNINTEEFSAGKALGVNFAIIDNLQVGYEYLKIENKVTLTPNDDASTYNLLRIGYSFTDLFGAAVSFGTHTDVAATSVAAAGLGAYADLFQKRAPVGFAYGFRIRLDYLARTADFGKGAFLFGIGANIGI
jgi:hypothetical protein